MEKVKKKVILNDRINAVQQKQLNMNFQNRLFGFPSASNPKIINIGPGIQFVYILL